jgi:putative ABC transport system substrate-binding protein
VNRRTFIAHLTGGLLAAEAQPRPRVARVAFLEGGNVGSHLWQATRDGLRDLGYVEGQNLIIEFRSAEGQFDRLPELVAELIRLRVDVIVTAGDPAVVAAKQATSTIPIVMAAVGDPVGRGFVTSLARPGGNVTGTSNLRNGANQTHPLFWAEAQASAQVIALTVYNMEVSSPGEFEHAFASMAQERVGDVVVLPDPMLRSDASLRAVSEASAA